MAAQATHVFGAPISRRRALLVLATLPAMLAAVPHAFADVTYDDVSGQQAQPTVAVQSGEGATRIATPYYAVWIEDGLFAEGFSYEYLESYGGASAVLNVYASSLAGPDGQADLAEPTAVPAYRIYCTAPGLPATPFSGTYAVAECGQAAGGGLNLAVARPYEGGFDDSGAYRPLPESPGCAAAQALVDAMAMHVTQDALTRLEAYGDGSHGIVTPWYTVTIPAGMFSGGWYYRYDDAVNDWPGAVPGAYCGRVLSVCPVAFGEPGFQVCCARDTQPQGSCATQTIAAFDGDWAGWSIMAYCDAASEEACARLGAYAALVRATDNPNMNPPVIW